VRHWRELRAGLIALAIGLGLLDGCPLPRNGTERKIADQRLGRTVAGAVAELEGVRTWLLRPVQPAADLFGLRQRWKLFAGAARDRYRMTIEVRAAGAAPWQLVYRSHDAAHDFRDAQITYRRVRGAWNPNTTYGARGGYPIFAGWIADRLFARDPRAYEVRVQMERITIGPHGGYHGTGAPAYTLLVTRDQRAALRRPKP